MLLYRNLPAGFRQFRLIEKAPWNFFQDALAFYVFTFYRLSSVMSRDELFLIPYNLFWERFF